eukprot:jgi/Psemu1/4292/gm1.4292_g
MMKFCTFALALIATFTIVSADYQCESSTTFHWADGSKPSKPSKADIDFLDKALLDSFEEAYKNSDLDMLSDEFESLEIGEDFASIVNRLRGNNDKPNLGEWLGSWYGTYISKMYIGCRLCEVDDDMLDTTANSLGGSDLALALNTSAEHSSWEKLFCEKVHSRKSFSTLTGCAIHLNNCETEPPSGEDDASHLLKVKNTIN